MHFVFLYHLRGDTHFLDLAGLDTKGKQFTLPKTISLQERLKHIGQLDTAYCADFVLGVYEFVVDGNAVMEGIWLRIKRGLEFKEPLPRQKS